MSDEKEKKVEIIKDDVDKLGDSENGFKPQEAQILTELNNINNTLIGLNKQYLEKKFAFDRVSKELDDIKSGRTQFPLLVQIANGIYKQIRCGQ